MLRYQIQLCYLFRTAAQIYPRLYAEYAIARAKAFAGNRMRCIVLSSFATEKNLSELSFVESQESHVSEEASTANLQRFLEKDASSEALLQFPFVHIPISVIEQYQSIEANKEILKDVIAFRCLFNIQERYLRLAHEILQSGPSSLKKINAREFEVGRDMFTQHFQKRRENLKKEYASSDLSQKLKYLNVLNHYKLNNSSKELVREINEKELLQWDESGIGLVYYTQLLSKNNLPFKHLLKPLEERLLSETKGSIEERAKAARALFTLPKFYMCYPKTLIDGGFALLAQRVEKMGNFELLQILRLVYEYTSKDSTDFIKKVLSFLCSIDFRRDESRVDFFLPLVLKALKYANVVKIDLEPTYISLLGKQEQYQPIFKLISKQFFHTMLFLWYKEKVSEDLLAHIKQHIIQGFKYYSARSIQSEETIKFLRVIVKYLKELSEEERVAIKADISKFLGPAMPKEVKYECLLILLEQPGSFLENSQNKQLVIRYANDYFESTCARNNMNFLQIKSNIEQNIALSLLLLKNQILTHSSLPQLETYEYSMDYMISQESLDKLVQYSNLTESAKLSQLQEMFAKLEPIIIHYLNKKRMGFRTILSIIELCAKVEYERKPIYFRIEKAIYEILMKFPSFIIKMHDLQLIKKNMLKRNFGTRGFQALILDSISDPKEWQQIRKAYIQHETDYWSQFQKRKPRGSKN